MERVQEGKSFECPVISDPEGSFNGGKTNLQKGEMQETPMRQVTWRAGEKSANEKGGKRDRKTGKKKSRENVGGVPKKKSKRNRDAGFCPQTS